MEADGDLPQLLSPPATLLRPVRHRHGHKSPIINPEALILVIPILVLLIIFLILPPSLSYTNHQILKPSSVQKGWDSINIFLVLIAVLCGIFAKRNDDNSFSFDTDGQKNIDAATNVSDDSIRRSIASSKWLDFPDKSEYDKMTSSRSYPDLRQESLWVCESNEFKSFDDFEVNFHRQPEKLYHRERLRQNVAKEAVTLPPPPVQRRRSVHRSRNGDANKSQPPPPQAAPSSPPLEPEVLPVTERTENIRREKNGAKKETDTAIASLQYGTQNQRKKKVKTRDIYESASENLLPLSTLVPPSTPPPPPPPPPSKGFQSLLKKSSKSKRVHSVSTIAQPPPPPPPPPPNSIFANIFKTGSKSKRSQVTSASSHLPPPPPPLPPYSIFNNIFSSGSKSKLSLIPFASSQPSLPHPSILISSFENLATTRRFMNSDTPTAPLPPPQPEIHPVYTGKPPKPPKPSTSSNNTTDKIVPPTSLIPMQPRPPLPQFRRPEINFLPTGHFPKKHSTNSSPELHDAGAMAMESDGGHSIQASVSCPSPDVNTKADTFISRLRDGWRLEKLNSINERQNLASTSNRL